VTPCSPPLLTLAGAQWPDKLGDGYILICRSVDENLVRVDAELSMGGEENHGR
jgi:hypothetical protein